MTEGGCILIVEDSPSLALTCKVHLEGLGQTLLIAEDGKSAYAILRDHKVDCVLLDLKLPDMDGIDILEDIRTWPAPPVVVVITSNASLTTAVRAVRSGAFDYLVKPFAQARLVTTVQNALANVALRREVSTYRRTLQSGGFGDFIGRSMPMQSVYRTLEAAASSTASVLITGESGTGKELAADALHRFSRRSANQFVALNCAAIPHDLMESVIFGHVKGAFTGATADQEGAAARADGGTLFLDEIGEMDMSLQSKLLRFIQTGTYERVGDTRSRKVDIRFVAATNRDPLQAIRDGQLREDLYYRLNVVGVKLPLLRERSDDILLIARRFLLQYAASDGKTFTSFSPEVEAMFLAYHWPGNVRQLLNVVRNIVVLNDGPEVTRDMVPVLAGESKASAVAIDLPAEANSIASVSDEPRHGPGSGLGLPSRPDDVVSLALMEQRYIENAIAVCGGNLQLASRKLGISPSTIYRKKEYWGQGKT